MERIAMSQEERDDLDWLKRAKDGSISQREAAKKMGVSDRWVRTLVKRMNQQGDAVVVHGLRGRPSNRKLPAKTQKQAVKILTQPDWHDFGPTFAAEQLAKRYQIQVGKETLRGWMMEAGLWKSKSRRLEQVHGWRPRRSAFGELVQWDTSEHDWLEGRGPKLYLVAMIDDATSRALARLVEHDTTAENMRLLWSWLDQFGRPLDYYTDKAGLFQVNRPLHHNKHLAETPPLTQIGRALKELGVGWIAAHSPQAKGRVERFFGTAQDRLVKGLRKAGASTREAANDYLERVYLPMWNERFTVEAANGSDAHRQLLKQQELAAILSHVEERVISNDYTFQFGPEHYQIQKRSIVPRMRGAQLRVEVRLDGTLTARWEGKYVEIARCPERRRAKPERVRRPKRAAGGGERKVNRAWMDGFWEQPAAPLWLAIKQSNRGS